MAKIMLVIFGPSGAGKTWFKNWFIEKGWDDVKSYTTREPRQDEGDEYNFVSEREFERLRSKELLVNVNNYHGHWYGVSSKDFVNCSYKSVLISDITSLDELKKHAKLARIELVFLFCRPASASVIRRRHVQRGTENRSSIGVAEFKEFDDEPPEADFVLSEGLSTHERVNRLFNA